MSHEIVKTIKIKDNKVFISSACNNVRPRTYSLEEFPYYTNILKEKGKEAIDIALLKSYEEGNLQGGVNKYSKALKVLRYVFNEEYKNFNWRNNNFKYDSKEYLKYNERREGEEFKELLKKALNYKFPKNSFIITKPHYDSESGVAYGKVCPTCIKWSRYTEKATKFNFREEAEDHIYNDYKNVWKVEELQ